MFGLGGGEIIIVLIVALLLLGPKQLPEIAKQLGKGLAQFRRATDDIKHQIEQEMYAEPEKPRPAQLLPAPEPAPGTVSHPPEPLSVSAPAAPPASVGNVPGLDAAMAEAPPQPKKP
jgi:TatA/E family protein of Tat protein translocase